MLKLLGISSLNQYAQKFILRAIRVVFLYTFIINITNTFIVLSALDNVTLEQFGVLMSAQFLVQAILDYPTGAIGDWIGQRWVLFISTLFYSIGFIIISVSSDFVPYLIAFILFGIAKSQESGTFISWFENNYKYIAAEDKDRRIYSHFYGKFRMIYEIITAVSFIFGGFLIFLTNREKVYLVQGILLLFISIIFIFSMKDSIPYKKNKGDKIIPKTYLHYLKNGFSSIFKSKALCLIVIGLTISGIGFALWSNLILFPLYSDYGKSDSNIAILRSIVFIFGSVLTGFAGSVSKRIKKIKKWLIIAVIFGDITFFICMYIMSQINPVPSTFQLFSMIIVIITFAIGFLPQYFGRVLKPRFFIDNIPDSYRNAIYSLIASLILIISGPIMLIMPSFLNSIGREGFILFLLLIGLIGSIVTAIGIKIHTPLIPTSSDKVTCCRSYSFPFPDTQSNISFISPCCWTEEGIMEFLLSKLKQEIPDNFKISEKEYNQIEKIIINLQDFSRILEIGREKSLLTSVQVEELSIIRKSFYSYRHSKEYSDLSKSFQVMVQTLQKITEDLEKMRYREN